MKFSIVIPTYNRARDLAETLASIAQLKTDASWEVIVVDNNSNDDTKAVVEKTARDFPVKLTYLFEAEQGRSAALNAGIRAAAGEIIMHTDDDVRIEPRWMDHAARALEELDCAYVGGKVLPLWNGPMPTWLPKQGGRHYSVLALLDYGTEPVEFGKRVALGVNMAFRREAFDLAGLWDNRVGRKAGTLLGQEVREWGVRAQKAGLRGFYVPEMVVHHVIPNDRLNKKYFRRWFYWHGISRAMLIERAMFDLESPENKHSGELAGRSLLGVHSSMYRKALSSSLRMAKALVKRQSAAAFEHELWLWFFAGIINQQLKVRHQSKAG